MITTTCDLCKKAIFYTGYVCRQEFISGSESEKMNWLMSNSKDPIIRHICHKCMNELIGEKK